MSTNENRHAIIAIRADHLHGKFCATMPGAEADKKVTIYLKNLAFHYQNSPNTVQFLELQLAAYSPIFNLIHK